MRLNDIIGPMVHGAVAKLRRDALVYGTCAVCAVAAVVLASSASIIALEPHVGAVYARLIVGGVFVLVALMMVVAVRLSQPRPRAPIAAASSAPRNPQFAQIAMIVEAVMLGYSLSRRSDRR
jgi:drug/metabolite transporter superfamily protein YnfA